MLPQISVVLPFRNASATLESALRSIREQTLGGWELLAVDDGSTDGAAEIVRREVRKDSRIRLLEPGRVGLVEALREGCRAAQGGFIARMDADDLAHPERFERQMAVLEREESVALCGTRVEDVGERDGEGVWEPGGTGEVGEGRRRYSSWLNGIETHEDVVRELFVECPLAHPTFLLRRAALEAVGGYRDRGWAEDYDLVLRLWREGRRFAVTPGPPLLRWRDWSGRLSRTDDRYSPDRFRGCKMHHLLRSDLLTPERPLLQWGAGQEGKAWLRLWPEERRPELVVDLDPRKQGKRIHGVRVIAPEELGEAGGALLVVAVGAAGARSEIRGKLTGRGWVETRDFVFVA